MILRIKGVVKDIVIKHYVTVKQKIHIIIH